MYIPSLEIIIATDHTYTIFNIFFNFNFLNILYEIIIQNFALQNVLHSYLATCSPTIGSPSRTPHTLQIKRKDEKMNMRSDCKNRHCMHILITYKVGTCTCNLIEEFFSSFLRRTSFKGIMLYSLKV